MFRIYVYARICKKFLIMFSDIPFVLIPLRDDVRDRTLQMITSNIQPFQFLQLKQQDHSVVD